MCKIGAKLKKRAKELDFSNAQVARRAGISEQTYYHYVNDRRIPDIKTAKRICQVLDLSLDELIGLK